MRLLSLAFAVALFTTVAQAEEDLIFVDGTRMEVESYEIRGNVVVFTTLDGKLRSVPLSYIDVAAIEGAPKVVASAEKSAAPVAPTPPPKLPSTAPVAHRTISACDRRIHQ